MAEGNWSVIRVEKISAEGAQKTERHNERKNESYANLNVDTEQIARNVHFKDTGGLTYNEYFQRLIDEGKISTRGQKAGATIFNELVMNTRYFEEHGGYEYAKQFYEEAYRFGCEIYGEDNIVSAVMHADEINKAVSEELGKPVLSDEKNQKTTYVTLVGLDQARADVAEISARAVSLLKELPGENLFLENLVTMLVERKK